MDQVINIEALKRDEWPEMISNKPEFETLKNGLIKLWNDRNLSVFPIVNYRHGATVQVDGNEHLCGSMLQTILQEFDDQEEPESFDEATAFQYFANEPKPIYGVYAP